MFNVDLWRSSDGVSAAGCCSGADRLSVMSVTEAPAEAAPATDVREAVHAVCQRARVAARVLATTPAGSKDAALLAVADALEAATDRIVEANVTDLERGRRDGLADGLLDRLR